MSGIAKRERLLELHSSLESLKVQGQALLSRGEVTDTEAGAFKSLVNVILGSHEKPVLSVESISGQDAVADVTLSLEEISAIAAQVLDDAASLADPNGLSVQIDSPAAANADTQVVDTNAAGGVINPVEVKTGVIEASPDVTGAEGNQEVTNELVLYKESLEGLRGEGLNLIELSGEKTERVVSFKAKVNETFLAAGLESMVVGNDETVQDVMDKIDDVAAAAGRIIPTANDPQDQPQISATTNATAQALDQPGGVALSEPLVQNELQIYGAAVDEAVVQMEALAGQEGAPEKALALLTPLLEGGGVSLESFGQVETYESVVLSAKKLQASIVEMIKESGVGEG